MRVLVFGTFDLLHDGHRFLLHEAEKRGDLFVIVARDHNVERIKGRLPADSEDVRAMHVQDVAATATVRLGDSDDFLAPLKAIQPDLILLGYDQQLPPGVLEDDLGCTVERLGSFMPNLYKTSILRRQREKSVSSPQERGV